MKRDGTKVPAKKKKPFLDYLATWLILMALVGTVYYLGPWLWFDVMQKGESEKVVEIEELAEESEMVVADGTVPQIEVSLNTDEGTLQQLSNGMRDREVTFRSWEEEMVFDGELESQVLIDGRFLTVVGQKVALRKLARAVSNQTYEPNRRLQQTIPMIDESLLEGEWVIADKIGLMAQINENQGSLQEGLERGAVRVPEYGRAGDKSMPMVVASHRFGYKWWWEQYGEWTRQNTFYYLPELVAGDLVQVIDGGRRWYYEIYATSEGEQITSPEADLILYTCKYLNSNQRIFKYARLIDPALYGKWEGTVAPPNGWETTWIVE